MGKFIKIKSRVIKDILERNVSQEAKSKALDSLIKDIETAKALLAGKYAYCSECDDYYLTASFLSDTERIDHVKICTFNSPINSGDNMYTNGYAEVTYSICPKGHRHEVSRKEVPYK